MLFSDYLLSESGNFSGPFSTAIDFDFKSVIKSMEVEDIISQTNVLNYFVYNNIITYTLGLAIPKINDYLERVLNFKNIEKAECETKFYIPKTLGGEEFKTILKNPGELVKRYAKNKSAGFNRISVVENAPNRKGITASSLTFVKIFGEYVKPETSGFRKDIRDKIEDTVSKYFREALTACKLNYEGDIRPKFKLESFKLPRPSDLDMSELDWISDNCFSYSISFSLCSR